jgi:hypothetical protein
MKNVIYITFWLLGILVFSSCEKSENTHNNPQYRLNDQSVIDQRLEQIAKVVAVAQNNYEFRSQILNIAKQNRMSENAVLYYDIANIYLQSKQLYVKDFFNNLSDSLSLNLPLDYFNCDIIDDLPQLTLFIYLVSDQITINQVDQFNPTIVMPEFYEFNDLDDFLQTSFDNNLVQKQISNNIEPEDQTVISGVYDFIIVISNYDGFIVTDNSFTLENQTTIWERMGVDVPSQEMEDSLSLAYTNSDNRLITKINTCNIQSVNLISYYGLRAMINRLSESDDDDPIPPPEDDCPRDDYDGREVLTEVQIDQNALKQFCKWTRTYVEIEFNQVLVANSTNPTISALDKIFSDKRKYVKKDKLHTLDASKYVRFLKFHFIEGIHADIYKFKVIGLNHNTGQTQTFSTTLGPSGKFKILGQEVNVAFSLNFNRTHTEKDKDLAEDVVYYCDLLNDQYDTGLIKFRITEEQ